MRDEPAFDELYYPLTGRSSTPYHRNMRRNNSPAARRAAKKRRALMLVYQVKGYSLTWIGRRFGGISKQRVHELIVKARTESVS